MTLRDELGTSHLRTAIYSLANFQYNATSVTRPRTRITYSPAGAAPRWIERKRNLVQRLRMPSIEDARCKRTYDATGPHSSLLLFADICFGWNARAPWTVWACLQCRSDYSVPLWWRRRVSPRGRAHACFRSK